MYVDSFGRGESSAKNDLLTAAGNEVQTRFGVTGFTPTWALVVTMIKVPCGAASSQVIFIIDKYSKYNIYLLIHYQQTAFLNYRLNLKFMYFCFKAFQFKFQT